MNYVVDRMHFKGHIDPWCRNNCDPDKLPVMERVHPYIRTLIIAVYTQFLPLLTGK